MQRKDCIAMILAGGKGERLGALTKKYAKPVIFFGGKYRIIDFTLSNCAHSGIDSIGLLTQYKPMALRDYINNGKAWEFDALSGGIFMLPSSKSGGTYTGTANAVYRNMDFVDGFAPEHVLILSGDHIYKMDYTKMLDFHKQNGADITISTVTVPYDEAHRFGIINADGNQRITQFMEKPSSPKSNLASMGIYVFKWSILKELLLRDQCDDASSHDFGKDVIPTAIASGLSLYAYRFEGYWRDVGTIQSLWESNMDLIEDSPPLNLYDDSWRIMTRAQYHAPCYLSTGAEVKRSIVAEGCKVHGRLSNSVLFDSVTVHEDAEVIDSIVMPNAVIGKGARVFKSIVGDDTFLGSGVQIGVEEGVSTFIDNRLCSKDISLIGPGANIEQNVRLAKQSHVQNGAHVQKHTRKNVVKVEMVYM